MGEIPKVSGPNYVPPGDSNPHNEGNIGQGPGIFKMDNMVRFQNEPDPVDPNLDAAIANRSMFRTGESLSVEQVVGAETPQELFDGLRSILKRAEDGNVPGELEDRYGLTRVFGMMHERMDVLKITPDEMKQKGYITNYDKTTGVAFPKKRKYASLALSIEEEPVIVEDRNGIKRQIDVDVTYNFGTLEQRKELAGAYEKAVTELETRVIIGSQLGLRLNPETRDSLETLVVYLRGGRTSKFRAEHLKSLFNLPDVEELGKNPESRKMGDQIEEAMFCNLVMLNCGTKEKMEDLLDRPGSKYLIAKMAKEHENRTDKAYTYDDWIKDNVGDYKKWASLDASVLADGTKLEARGPETYKNEKRGTLTKWSNIAAEYDENFGGDEEKKFIEETIGGLVGSIEASWIAASMMRVTGTYTSEGYLALKNGPSGEFRSKLSLGEDGFISGDDTGKFWSYMQSVKEGTKGRNSFLADMVGKIPDMAMNLFDWCQVKVKLDNGVMVNRSIWDAWLGTAKDKDILDILTLKPTDNKTKEEGYHRLGDIDFKSLRRDFHGKFATMQWLMGSGERPTGVLPEAWRTEFKPDDFKLVELKKIRKYVGIVFNPTILTKGSTHRFDTSKDTILKRNFLRNLMIARIHSFSFSSGVLNSGKNMFDSSTGKTEVLDPVWIRAVIKEILKEIPRNEYELKKHYIDENVVIKSLGKGGTGGTRKDVVELLNDPFLPEKAEEGLSYEMINGKPGYYVGKVTGKNYFG